MESVCNIVHSGFEFSGVWQCKNSSNVTLKSFNFD